MTSKASKAIKQQQLSMQWLDLTTNYQVCARYLDIITQNLYLRDVKISDPCVMRASAVIWSLRPMLPALGHEAQRDLGTCDATQHLVGDNHTTRD